MNAHAGELLPKDPDLKHLREVIFKPSTAPAGAEIGFLFFEAVRDAAQHIIDWILVHADPNALGEFGLELNDIAGKSVYELFGAAIEQTALGSMAQRAMRTRTGFCQEVYLPWSDRHSLVSFFPVDEGRLAVTVVDVTEKTRLDETLRASELRLNLALEAAGAGMWIRDRDGGWQTSRQLNILFGLPAESPPMQEQEFASLIHPEDLPQVRRAWETVFSLGQPYAQEYRVIWPDGSLHWLASRGKVIASAGSSRFIGITCDITGRKHMEEKLKESERQYRELVTHAPVGIFEVDFRRNAFLSLNDAMCQLTGYTREELMAKNPFELLDEEGRRLFQQRVQQWLAGEKPDTNVEYRVITKDGHEIYTFLDVNFKTDAEGRPIGATVIGHDITARKREEEALRESEDRFRIMAEELREVDRQKNEFMAILSHELRNPMASIQNCLEILGRTPPGGEQALRAKAVIDRQFSHLRRLVDDLLDITRIQRNKIQLNRKRLDVNDLARRAAEDHRSLFEKEGIRLEVEYAAEPIRVIADGDRLMQVIGNLLQNAVKFSPEGGSVYLSVSVDPARKQACIRVLDTGEGIEADVLPQLFQPFMQAEKSKARSRGGLGLGLALAKELVELHGGQIAAYSAGAGKGAQFTVHLPLDPSGTEESGPQMKEAAPARKRVLIIEDNADLASSLTDLLELEGHEVAAAHDGSEGLFMARQYRPDVLLCDIGLPGMDGYAVAQAFRADKELSGVYLVALSGYAQPSDLQKAAAAGFDRHLAKPPAPGALEKTLAEIKNTRG